MGCDISTVADHLIGRVHGRALEVALCVVTDLPDEATMSPLKASTIAARTGMQVHHVHATLAQLVASGTLRKGEVGRGRGRATLYGLPEAVRPTGLLPSQTSF